MEYKFRGQGIETGTWYYGGTFEDEEYSYIITDIKKHGIKAVISKTVGQSTGVKDINKKESYLGDILKEPGNKYDYGIIEKESESNNMFITWWYPSNSDCKLWNSMKLKLSYIKQFEVVGNIYTNPEMIKKEVEE